MSETPDVFEDEGEYVDATDFSDDVEVNEDGSAVVTLDSAPRRGDSEFYDNIAEGMSDTALNAIGSDLLSLIEQDKEARKKRDEQYKKGLQRTGLGDDAPGGAEFEGASRVVHPMLTEVSVDFSSRAIKELWPANGPVKSKIVGPETESLWDKAQRKSDFMNWQLTIGCPEARTEFEQMLTQLPLGGGQYMKITWDEARNRPTYLFIAIDDIYLPFSASNFYTAQRKTHVQYLTQLEYEQRVRSGMYRDVTLPAPSQHPERSAADIANDKIEGRDDNGAYNTDGVRTVYEVYATYRVEEDDLTDAPAPYIITVDESSRKVLSIYRNWDEDDASQEELQWIVEFPFVPWRGAYPIGMTQMIGGLSGAATGALRALLDAAHISNSQTMLKLKGGTRGGQSLTIQPTEVLEIEGGINVDDIRKMAMPLPFNQPSETLFRLLGFLVEAGKGVVRTTLDPTIESQENTPVGTTLARIEQGMTVFSAIHERLHNAMQRMLSVQHRLNAMYLDDARVKKEVGSVIASRADFDGPMDVVPVSDPRIFSEAQRFAQTQAVAQRAQLNPALYNARKVEQRILQTLNVPGYEELLAPEVTPKEENAVAENVKATLGKPIVAFPDQDHIAHLKTHIPFMQSPIFGASRLIAPSLTPVMLNHIKEHLALWYAQETFATADENADGSLSDMIAATKTAADKRALDGLVAEASQDVVEVAPAVFQGLPEVVEQAMQLMQQLAPQGPQDPATQVAMADVQMRGQTAQAKLEFDKEKAQREAQEKAAEQAAETQRVEIRERHEDMRTQIEVNSRVEMNDADNQTAEELALLRLAGGASASMNANPNPQPR